MSLSRSIKYFRLRSQTIVLGSILAVSALGQFQAPVVMAPLQQLKDEFGQTLQGHAQAPGDLAVAYWALDGVAHPPEADGTPHSLNIPVPAGKAGVGTLTPRSFQEPGVFNLTITRNLANQSFLRDGNKLFVRVFNAPTIEEASFYTDSQILVQKDGERFRLIFPTSATDQPLDSGDDDGDGLNNSYEKSLETDPNNPDTDGDGMNDGNEFVAGTDGTNEDSLLQITSMLEAEGKNIYLSWQSVPGKIYHVQANAFLTDTNGFQDVTGCELTATSSVSRIVVPDQFLDKFYNYRVVVCPDP